MMYKDDVLWVAGLEDFYDELEDPNADLPITPDMNLGTHSPDEYVEFWKANKERDHSEEPEES